MRLHTFLVCIRDALCALLSREEPAVTGLFSRQLRSHPRLHGRPSGRASIERHKLMGKSKLSRQRL
jgi:hypothetical protein